MISCFQVSFPKLDDVWKKPTAFQIFVRLPFWILKSQSSLIPEFQYLADFSTVQPWLRFENPQGRRRVSLCSLITFLPPPQWALQDRERRKRTRWRHKAVSLVSAGAVCGPSSWQMLKCQLSLGHFHGFLRNLPHTNCHPHQPRHLRDGHTLWPPSAASGAHTRHLSDSGSPFSTTVAQPPSVESAQREEGCGPAPPSMSLWAPSLAPTRGTITASVLCCPPHRLPWGLSEVAPCRPCPSSWLTWHLADR